MTLNNILFESIFEESDLGLILVNESQKIVTWNSWMSHHCKAHLSDSKDRELLEVFPSAANSSLTRAMVHALQYRLASVLSYKLNQNLLPLVTASGNPLSQEIKVKPIKGINGERFCLIQVTDISAAVSRDKQLQEQAYQTKLISLQLAQAMERAQVTLDSIADAVIATDENGLITLLNPVAETLLGIPELDAKLQPVSDLFTITSEEDESQPLLCPVQECLKSLKTIYNDEDHVLINRNGQRFSINDSVAPIICDSGNLLGAVLVFRDVTASRSLTTELSWHAKHDMLTGLLNRHSFEEKMESLLERAKKQQGSNFVLYMDLDQFKVVNDTCGHDAGDELLKQIAMLFTSKLRANDVLARLGGDEFGVILENCPKNAALVIAEKLLVAVQQFRFGWQTNSFKIGVSIGVTPITGKEGKAAEILSAVDSACYAAKDSGRNRIHFYDFDDTGSSIQQREMRWISKIQKALDEDQFILYGQSIQDLRQNRNVADHYEVLIRMVGAKGEIIAPGAFIPSAERFNLMASVDRWVIDKVFQNALSSDFSWFPSLSINISGMSISDDALLAHILGLMKEYPFIAQKLCFEVTETAAIANLNKAIYFLTSLRELGCKIALDDFGSGLSSFAYLKQLPVDYLKIDGLFVKDMIKNPINRTFVETIHRIGQAMGLITIAEFVESVETIALLKEIGVDFGQGYGFHIPCPLTEILDACEASNKARDLIF